MKSLGLVCLVGCALAAGSAVAGCGVGGRDGGGGGSGGTGGGDLALGGGGSGGGDMGPCTDVVDVVFVLDVSSSMTFVLDKLNAEIDQVVTRANMLAADAHFGLIAFADNYRLDATGPLSGGKVHTAGATLKAAFQNYKAVYTLNDRNPGDDPTTGPTSQNPICEENALDSLHAAAAEFPWRDNATRVVILVTDDTFLERPDNYGDRDGDGMTNKMDFPREGNYPALWTVGDTTAALRGMRARVFGFTRLKEPGLLDASRCGTGRRLPWSSISDGWSTPYKGQMPIPTQTAGKNFDLDLVKSGALSLTATINEVVVQSFCNPPIY
ncbi:MAG: hypothetical protein JWN44_722 [Myxococcales bacterium]|nr:hypothetical protein [Myxococcales bacterium]